MGLPFISDACCSEIKVSDVITHELLGITSYDLISKLDLDIKLDIAKGTQSSGKNIVVSATITDDYGNTDVRYYSITVR